MKILLVSPDFNPEDTKARATHFKNPKLGGKGLQLFPQRGFMVPLGLATVAALTPKHIEVDIWDEAVKGMIDINTQFKKQYDLVGVTGYVIHTPRMRKLGSIFRERGVPTAVGGPGVSASTELFRDYFDALFINETEFTWPQSLSDFESGSYQPEYRQVAKPNLEKGDSPIPCWDSIACDLKKSLYFEGAVQTTRGCPYDCDFCDVVYLYGRMPRHKPVEQVIAEIETLRHLGMTSVFLCDDNFIGNPEYAKALLRELVKFNKMLAHPVGFMTQATLNVTKDEEMLALMADANFTSLFVGVETPSEESLLLANKAHNITKGSSINESVKKIHSYGIQVQAGMIVGFDGDDTTIFQRQFEFLQNAGIGTPMLNALKAPTGTPFWVRLLKEGRVVRLRKSEFEEELGSGAPDALSNIIPKQMTRQELYLGYKELLQKVRNWRNFEIRVMNMLSQVRRKPKVKQSWFPSRRTIRQLPAVLYLFLSMNKEARGASFRLLSHALTHSRFMFGKVTGQIARQYLLTAHVSDVVKMIDLQMELEQEEGALEVERKVFSVPDGFREPFIRKVFPELYKRAHEALGSKTLALNALVETVHDFLVRWGSAFEELQEYHVVSLREVCDRAIAAATVRKGAEEFSMPSGKELRQMASEVLRNAEQRLRVFQLQEVNT